MSSRVLNSGKLKFDFMDSRRARQDQGGVYNRIVGSRTIFTANGAGTTTTIVGANAAPGTNDVNTIRRGERFKLFTSAGVLKEETVFEVTNIAVAASTTVTFAPAAAGATASGDFAKQVGLYDLEDPEALDGALTAIDGTVYSADRLAQMTLKDMVFAYRQKVDPAGL